MIHARPACLIDRPLVVSVICWMGFGVTALACLLARYLLPQG